MKSVSDREMAAELRRIALAAGEIIMTIYNGEMAVRSKADKSPVTDADEAAEELILADLARLTPDIPVIAEELAAAGGLPQISGNRFWLVDPLDGTREFIKRNGEFTVNIALVEDGRPVLGIVHVPAIGVTYYGDAHGATVERGGDGPRPATARAAPAEGIVALVSRSHRSPEIEAFLADYTVATERSAGSSLKFCLVATGEADLYPRLGRTMEWDTAAGHAVVNAAGGSVRTLDGDDLAYGKPGFENPSFVVRGR